MYAFPVTCLCLLSLVGACVSSISSDVRNTYRLVSQAKNSQSMPPWVIVWEALQQSGIPIQLPEERPFLIKSLLLKLPIELYDTQYFDELVSAIQGVLIMCNPTYVRVPITRLPSTIDGAAELISLIEAELQKPLNKLAKIEAMVTTESWSWDRSFIIRSPLAKLIDVITRLPFALRNATYMHTVLLYHENLLTNVKEEVRTRIVEAALRWNGKEARETIVEFLTAILLKDNHIAAAICLKSLEDVILDRIYGVFLQDPYHSFRESNEVLAFVDFVIIADYSLYGDIMVSHILNAEAGSLSREYLNSLGFVRRPPQSCEELYWAVLDSVPTRRNDLHYYHRITLGNASNSLQIEEQKYSPMVPAVIILLSIFICSLMLS